MGAGMWLVKYANLLDLDGQTKSCAYTMKSIQDLLELILSERGYLVAISKLEFQQASHHCLCPAFEVSKVARSSHVISRIRKT